MSFSRIIGPTIAGVLVATIGLAGCFLVNAASYLLVVLVLLLLHSGEFFPSPRAPQVRGQMSAGLDYAKSNHPVLIALVMMTLIGTITYEFSVVLPLMATQTFHAGAAGYACMNAMMGAGAWSSSASCRSASAHAATRRSSCSLRRRWAVACSPSE
jgi:MFS family permease